jgi:branched-chain amino acid transport system ATP-binding protein
METRGKTMIVLECKNISKRFGGLWALKQVNIQIKEKEILGIIGPNGAGKTTLFNVITGFVKPDEGRVIAFGKDITGKEPYEICKLGIARTFQVPKPFPNLTVLENVAIGALIRSKSVNEAVEKAKEILDLVGLSHKKDVYGRDLTVLEMKRLELAKALATEPKILLLDEVMAGLKPAEVDEVLQVIKSIRKRGITVVIIEHVMRAVQSVCERVVVLDRGKVIAEGTPEEVSRNDEVIKSYLGREYRLA